MHKFEMKIWSIGNPTLSSVEGGTVTTTDNGDGTWSLTSDDNITHVKDFIENFYCTKVEVINGSTLTSLEDTFSGFSNMKEFIWHGDSIATNFNSTFYNCINLVDYSGIPTSHGTTFVKTWANCFDLVNFPIHDLSNGIDFRQTWYNCRSLLTFPEVDLSHGTNFNYAWYNCRSIEIFHDLDLRNAARLMDAWSGCSNLKRFTLLNFNKLEEGTNAFQGCDKLTHPKISGTAVRSGDNAIRGVWLLDARELEPNKLLSMSYTNINDNYAKPPNDLGQLGDIFSSGTKSPIFMHDGYEWHIWDNGTMLDIITQSKFYPINMDIVRIVDMIADKHNFASDDLWKITNEFIALNSQQGEETIFIKYLGTETSTKENPGEMHYRSFKKSI